MPDVAGTLAAGLRAEGVPTVFGLLGEANLALVLATRAAGIEWVALRREDSVVAAADGFAQGTGRLGVGFVSQGPALANALNPLIGAAKGGTPLLLITGAHRPERTSEPQWLDQRALIEGTGHVDYLRVDEPGAAPGTIAEAIARARSGRALVLELPTWLQLEPVPAGAATDRMGSPPAVPATDPEVLDRLAARLAAAERPVLIAGRGAAHAREELLGLAAASGALLATTLLQRGMFDGEPGSMGVIGGFATTMSRELMRAADLIVTFGAGLNQFTTERGRLFEDRPVVRVDIEAHPLTDSEVPAELVVGDAAVVAAALSRRLSSQRRAPWHPDPAAPDEIDDRSNAYGLDLRTASRWLDQTLPRDRAFAVDLGYYSSEPCIHIGVRAPNRQAFTLHFGSIGLGLATGIGLSHAHPELVTLAAVGDGGLMSSLQELETVARLNLPIVIAVYNDDAYAVEVYELRHRGLDDELAVFDAVDFAAVARGLGIEAFTLSSPDELAAATDAVRAHRGPLLLDLRLRRGVITRWYRDSVHPDFPHDIPEMETAS